MRTGKNLEYRDFFLLGREICAHVDGLSLCLSISWIEKFSTGLPRERAQSRNSLKAPELSAADLKHRTLLSVDFTGNFPNCTYILDVVADMA
jgi:hypothetical protein